MRERKGALPRTQAPENENNNSLAEQTCSFPSCNGLILFFRVVRFYFSMDPSPTPGSGSVTVWYLNALPKAGLRPRAKGPVTFLSERPFSLSNSNLENNFPISSWQLMGGGEAAIEVGITPFSGLSSSDVSPVHNQKGDVLTSPLTSEH